MRRTTVCVIAVTLALVTTGCYSSQHVGRDPRKVYQTMKDGQPGFSKGGRFIRAGAFGGGLVEAVKDNPEAAKAARTFRSRTITGFVVGMLGLVCAESMLLYDLAYVSTTDEHAPQSHLYVVVGCAVAGVLGFNYMASGAPYAYDALNIYNDDVDAQGALPGGQPVAPWPPPPRNARPPIDTTTPPAPQATPEGEPAPAETP